MSACWIGGRTSFHPCEELEMLATELGYVAVSPALSRPEIAGMSQWCPGGVRSQNRSGDIA